MGKRLGMAIRIENITQALECPNGAYRVPPPGVCFEFRISDFGFQFIFLTVIKCDCLKKLVFLASFHEVLVKSGPEAGKSEQCPGLLR